jgi:hypothetical protein
VSLDESILGENGKVSFDKFHPLAFDWMNKIYLSLGEKVGNAYKDGLAIKVIIDYDSETLPRMRNGTHRA